jgi:signal transduction histidine kinase
VELERRGRELEALSSRKSQMMASISHDIRTPIQSITLMAELLRRTATSVPASTAQMAVLAQRLQSHALSAAELLSEVIDLASFDQGTVTLHPSDFSLNELLQEQCGRLAPQADAKGLVLRTAEGLPALTLHTDRAKLGRVLANLANNAIKFTSQGNVTLSFEVDDAGSVHIRVADTGCGISPDNLEQIFGEFCQLDSAAARPGSGWGLGLAICRRLTSLLGGELRVESAIGKGSTFAVVLRRQQGPAEPEGD